jgi:hypothetical protein
MPVKLYYIADLLFEDPSNPITVGNGKYRVEAPFDGELLGSRNGPRISGCILNAGTGAGTVTRIQIRNATKGHDYFDTGPEFRVDSKDTNNRAVIEGGLLSTKANFKAGDELYLDVDAIPGGSNSAQMQVWLTCGFWRET